MTLVSKYTKTFDNKTYCGNTKLNMIDEFYFLEQGNSRITAASVGISRRRWESANSQEIETNSYIEKMSKNRFDILPIDNDKNSLIKEYFKTNTLNDFTIVNRHSIHFYDTIPLDTDIQTVIDKFHSESRIFYFLTQQNIIKGLITIGNLNCKQVQIFIFSKICDLERLLGEFINSKLNSTEIRKWIKGKMNPDIPDDKYYNILSAYDNLVNLGLENKITEYFFFVDFFNLIREKELCKDLGYSKTKWDNFNSINQIRNRIAHPIKSLLDSKNDVNKLSERLSKIDELLFKLKNE